MSNIKIGVINWDCSLPSDTYFGFHATKSLSPKKYRHATPFYADLLADDKIDYHIRTVEEYEQEMQYAIDAGIDYFAYCWYGDDDGANLTKVSDDMGNVVDNKVWELTYARKLHVKSSLKDKLKLCAVVVAIHPMSQREIDNLALEMQKSYYQKVDGRPLMYVFGGYRESAIVDIRNACKKLGTVDPYVAILKNDAYKEGSSYPEAQAISEYATGITNITTQEQFIEGSIAQNELKKAYGLTVIPHFSTGWDPSPRIDNPVPWVAYSNVPYAPSPSEDELMRSAERLADWIKENREYCSTDHILTFAWNEFEEGGWICPTYDNDCNVTMDRLNAFKKVTNYWRKTL